MSTSTPAAAYLDPSPLGTKEYWSSLYSSDLDTRQHTLPTHTGTTWFDDADAEGKTIRYLNGVAHDGNLSYLNTTFLDLGTGNGSLLSALRKAGWAGRMMGVDYAEESVLLAEAIWAGIVQDGWDASTSDEDSDDEAKPKTQSSLTPLEFRTLDILSLTDSSVPLPPHIPQDGFDIVLDKGTFDAVSLSSDNDPYTGKRAVESYAVAARRFLKKPDGLMIVTSCNWTESELERWFCGDELSPDRDGDRLKVVDRVPYRTLKFGGREGSVVVGMVFGWQSRSLKKT